MCPVHHRGRDERRARKRLRLLTTRIRITVWDGRSPEPVAQTGFGVVADLSATGVGFFFGESLAVGAPLRLEFEDGISLRGIVMSTMRYVVEQRFLGHEAHPFRLGVKFRFGSEAERQRYLAFLKQVEERALLLDQPGRSS